MAVTGIATWDGPRSQGVRSFWSYAGGALLIVFGLLNGFEWKDDSVTSVLLLAAGICLLPPVLRRIRSRLPWTQNPVAPVSFFFLAPLIAWAAGIPFVPSASQLAQHRVETIRHAERMLKEGKVAEARLTLNDQRGSASSDIARAGLLRRIELADKLQADQRAAVAAGKVEVATKVREGERAKEKAAERQEEEEANRLKVRDNAEGQALLTTIRALQADAHDPTSLLITGHRVIRETLEDGTPILRVYVAYRGTNGFGGVVSERAVLTMSPDGKRTLGMQRVS